MAMIKYMGDDSAAKREEGIAYILSGAGNSAELLKWTAKRELVFLICTPPAAAKYYQDNVEEVTEFAKIIAGDKELDISTKQENGWHCMVFSGEGAVELARAIRDEGEAQFAGCASIPDGPSKG